jgi:hypothetical protein
MTSEIEPKIMSSIEIVRLVYKFILECIKCGITTKDEFDESDISFNNLIKIAFKTEQFKIIQGKKNTISILFEEKELLLHSKYINKEVQKIYKDFIKSITKIKPVLSIEKPREVIDIKYIYSKLDKFIV